MRLTLFHYVGFSMLSLAAACGEPEVAPPDPGFEDVGAALARFEADSVAFMAELPKKTGNPEVTLFSSSDISSDGYITAKNKYRKDAPADAPTSTDRAATLVDNASTMLKKLSDMDTPELKKAKLAESPWSDDYWALYQGSIAKRYTDTKYPSASATTNADWQKRADYLRSTPPANADDLSPAEKYDLLVGDSSKSLTNFNIETYEPYYDPAAPTDQAETWMGICHGWAPAAFMLQRPIKTVEVLAANGTTKIKFYPSDMKALSSELWANGESSTRFIGGRCEAKKPPTDAIGRIVDSKCRDNNAGTWHLAIVNQIGKNKRSFVLDATYDYEVWNQPVYGYTYSYFNPKTNTSTSSLTSAKVAVADFSTDKFKAYRATGTSHIVGITMDVQWVVETNPSHFSPDSPTRDAISGARYLYTLELNSAGEIIGGEWLQNAHPDFLWTPPPGTEAEAWDEFDATGTWDGKTVVPATWRTAAASSSDYGQPLGKIVKQIITMSRQ